MRVAFIHNERKIGTGAHYINDLMASKLQESGVEIKNFYPKTSLMDVPIHLGGLKNILFFYSLLEKRGEILKFDIIQGTTYTPLPFLCYPVPVVSHFGSTTHGFLSSTPHANKIDTYSRGVWHKLYKKGIIKELNIETRRPLRDIAEIEKYVASRATVVIAVSEHVKKELIDAGIDQRKIHLIHNAIEDYWFENVSHEYAKEPGIVFLGRLGSDAFTLRLKGVDRLIDVYQNFPNIQKTTFCMTTNKLLTTWMRSEIPNHTVHANIKKDKIPDLLRPLKGNVLFISSRYEGFSLSLVEGMSQGLVPVVYPVGIAPEIIQNGENGFLVSSQDEAKERIKQLISDPDMRMRLSEKARETSLQFTGEATAKKLITLYTSLKKPNPSWMVQE